MCRRQERRVGTDGKMENKFERQPLPFTWEGNTSTNEPVGKQRTWHTISTDVRMAGGDAEGSQLRAQGPGF